MVVDAKTEPPRCRGEASVRRLTEARALRPAEPSFAEFAVEPTKPAAAAATARSEPARTTDPRAVTLPPAHVARRGSRWLLPDDCRPSRRISPLFRSSAKLRVPISTEDGLGEARRKGYCYIPLRREEMSRRDGRHRQQHGWQYVTAPQLRRPGFQTNSVTGNRTLVSRVAGGDTSHYTITDY
ncbi:hypothetical protein THAOC_37147 [Thalassiosira oceanica]|uniref:Uncharacterized protein n=1 Tax=Thalassiosira oceanica TaxID=159749 RepID=K0QZ49_THAOC|nr:hypothetical protein THAOC_37147 [Thalassiosira oceanica]|eukprot:EJK44320.1 hypothetical protein THAOC_37147 [Thalassiosira oceanica]